MFASNSGKLLVYASDGVSDDKRLRSVSVAAEKMAKLLRFNVEVVTFKEEFAPIYVYYKNAEEEPIPLYCDKGEESTMQEIYDALEKMIFVLSFHPKHSALKQIIGKVIRFS